MQHLTRSKIFLYILITFVLGIFLGPVFGDFLVGIPMIAKLLYYYIVILLLFFPIPKIPKIIIILTIPLLLGAWRYQSFLPKVDEGHIGFYNDSGERLGLVGVVDDEPVEKGNSLQLKISNIQFPIFNQYSTTNKQLEGKILLNIPKYYEVEYGDKISFSAKLVAPQEYDTFDYQEYLARYGVYSIAKNIDNFVVVTNYQELRELSRIERMRFSIGSGLYKIKNYFSYVIKRIYPEPHAGLMLGILIGAKTSLPDWLTNIFQIIGITHIIAISGYNITILAKVADGTFGRVGRKFIFWGVLAMIIAFVVMTGASASVVRAGIMGGLLVYAGFIGRRSSVVNVLVFAGAIMILLNPLILRSDIGFQLSFLATMGLVFVSPIFEKWLVRVPEFFRVLLSATLSAQVFTLPILISSFGLVSLVSPLANIVVLPFIPISMFLGFLSGILGMLWLPLGKIVGFIGYIILEVVVKASELLARVPYASIDVRANSWWVWSIYYLVIGLLIWRWHRRKNLNASVNLSRPSHRRD